MGGRQSRAQDPPPPPNDDDDYDDDDDAACMPCFFMNGVSQQLLTRTRSADPIGTPLPETPLFQRKRRQQVQHALRTTNNNDNDKANNNNTAVFSSRYGGLEKEVSTSNHHNRHHDTTQNGRNDIDYDDEGPAVHEGPDSEAQLHAKYQLEEVMGVGSTSTVHRCTLKRTDQDFACKVIDCQSVEERFQGMMTQFQTEVEALRQLKHPGIIQLYDVYLTDQKIYIVMEHMAGGELFDYVVQKGTLTEEEASKIVRKVTSAIVFMHERNSKSFSNNKWQCLIDHVSKQCHTFCRFVVRSLTVKSRILFSSCAP